MKYLPKTDLSNVQGVYSGPEGELWELVMGQQIHIGGMVSSTDLANRAGIGDGMQGVDLCCCTGAGMRFLIRYCGVAAMTGVDATPKMTELGRQRAATEGFDGKMKFVLADVCDGSLASASADFVWGEDAWCYVVDKPTLIAEAARIVKPGGPIAFTDWVEGTEKLTDEEATRFLTFMKFPSFASIADYTALLEANDCEVVVAEDTGRFPDYVDLYLNMLNMQLTYDALKVIGFDTELMTALAGEMAFMQELAHAGKIAQGMFVARKGHGND